MLKKNKYNTTSYKFQKKNPFTTTKSIPLKREKNAQSSIPLNFYSCPRRGPRMMPRILRQNFGVSRLFRPKLRMFRLSRPMPKFSRPNFGMSRLSRTMSTISRPNIGVSRLLQPTARLMSRLSKLKLSARLCTLGLNLDAGRPSNSGHESVTSTRV